MKRSRINQLVAEASLAFKRAGWTLPPHPKWDVTDFGLGDVDRCGLVLVNLAEEPEYCEKLMYARRGMVTPAHTHRKKKEDIISRRGELGVTLWADERLRSGELLSAKVNGSTRHIPSGEPLMLKSGERITLIPGMYHSFAPVSLECVIGEVSTANDDIHDNFFVDPKIGRFAQIEEDETPLVQLVSEL